MPTTANSNTTCTHESPIVKKHTTTTTEGNSSSIMLYL